jgi:hypothetical protein
MQSARPTHIYATSQFLNLSAGHSVMKYVRKFLVISSVPSSLGAHIPSANHSVSNFLGN